MISAFFTDGIVVWIAWAWLAIEGLFLWRAHPAYLRRMLAHLLAGAALLGALYAALIGATWYWLASGLVLGLIAHGIDLRMRLTGLKAHRAARHSKRQ